MHQHDEHCACGHHHEGHHHGEHHGHAHGDGCGCGCGHAHREIETPDGLTPLQADVLLALYQRKSLPVACFALAHSADDVYAVALAPVYIGTPDDSMEQVKQIGEELLALAEASLLSLDYDIPLKGYAYDEYRQSIVYRYFEETVREAAQIPGHLFDTPVLELGSMALTEAGEKMVDGMLA